MYLYRLGTSCSPELDHPLLLDDTVHTRNFIIQAILVLRAVSDALRRVWAVYLAVTAAVLDAFFITQAPLRPLWPATWNAVSGKHNDNIIKKEKDPSLVENFPHAKGCLDPGPGLFHTSIPEAFRGFNFLISNSSTSIIPTCQVVDFLIQTEPTLRWRTAQHRVLKAPISALWLRCTRS